MEDISSITVRNIPAEAKRNFETLCTAIGISPQEALRRYISSLSAPNEIEIVTNTAYALCFNCPNLVDEYIALQEPFYSTIEDDQRKTFMRMSFASSNPSYIFKKYAETLQKQEVSEND